MFYVKLDETEHGPGELIAADTDDLRWSRVFIPEAKTGTDDPERDVLVDIARAKQLKYSVAHVGDVTPQHPDGDRTVHYVHWFDRNMVGHLVVTTQTIYIVGENGKTIDRV